MDAVAEVFLVSVLGSDPFAHPVGPASVQGGSREGHTSVPGKIIVHMISCPSTCRIYLDS